MLQGGRDAQQRRLARAVGPDDHPAFVELDRPRDRPDENPVAAAQRDLGEVDQQVGVGAVSSGIGHSLIVRTGAATTDAQPLRASTRFGVMRTKNWTSGPIPNAYKTVPTPTVPPSSHPTASTVASMQVLTSRTERPVRATRPVISPSRGPGPRPAPM